MDQIDEDMLGSSAYKINTLFIHIIQIILRLSLDCNEALLGQRHQEMSNVHFVKFLK